MGAQDIYQLMPGTKLLKLAPYFISFGPYLIKFGPFIFYHQKWLFWGLFIIKCGVFKFTWPQNNCIVWMGGLLWNNFELQKHNTLYGGEGVTFNINDNISLYQTAIIFKTMSLEIELLYWHTKYCSLVNIPIYYGIS